MFYWSESMISGTGPKGGRRVRAELTLLAACAMMESCLIAPPPDFQDPTPQRPNVSMGLVVPAPWQTLIVERNGPAVLLTVPFQVDDAGEKVIAQLWLNWGLASERVLGQKSWEAQMDLNHQISWSWNPDLSVPEQCQQLTLVITHESNISDSSPIKPIDPELTAFISWWLNVDADPMNPNTLVNCPGPSPG